MERELAIAESSGNLDDQARAHSNLGVMIHLRGDADGDREQYRGAMTHYRAGIELHRRLGERHFEIRMTLNMAQACVRLGRDGEASALIRESLATAVSLAGHSTPELVSPDGSGSPSRRGETEIGLAYLGLFMRQPSTGSIDEHETDRILARTSLTPEAIEVGMAHGADLDLDIVVEDLLAPGTAQAQT